MTKLHNFTGEEIIATELPSLLNQNFKYGEDTYVSKSDADQVYARVDKANVFSTDQHILVDKALKWSSIINGQAVDSGHIDALNYTGNSASATKANQDGKGNDIANTYATKSELNAKATKSTTLGGYGIVDAYTKEEVEALIGSGGGGGGTGGGDYVLPIATSNRLGGVKIGDNINITSGVISVADSSISSKGVVQLTDSTSSTSTTSAATPASVKSAYDLAKSKADKATTLAGYGIKDAYTKAEVDAKVGSGGGGITATTLAGYGITDAYTKSEVDTKVNAKATKATTLGGYGITNAYTKGEVNYVLEGLAEAIDESFVTVNNVDQVILGKKLFANVTSPEDDGTVIVAGLDTSLGGWNVSNYNVGNKDLVSIASYNAEGMLFMGFNETLDSMGMVSPDGFFTVHSDGSTGTLFFEGDGANLNGYPILTGKGGTLSGTSVITEVENGENIVGTIFEANEDNNPIVISSNRSEEIDSHCELEIGDKGFNLFCITEDGDSVKASGIGTVDNEGTIATISTEGIILATTDGLEVDANYALNLLGADGIVYVGSGGLYQDGFLVITGDKGILTHNGYVVNTVNGNYCDAFGNVEIPLATTTKAGVMSPADKAKLDGLTSGGSVGGSSDGYLPNNTYNLTTSSGLTYVTDELFGGLYNFLVLLYDPQLHGSNSPKYIEIVLGNYSEYITEDSGIMVDSFDLRTGLKSEIESGNMSSSFGSAPMFVQGKSYDIGVASTPLPKVVGTALWCNFMVNSNFIENHLETFLERLSIKGFID